MPHYTDDENILVSLSEGDEKAFEELFFIYQPRVVNFLTALTHDREASRDLAQDLFLNLWNDHEKLKNIAHLSSYLFQMARFSAYNYLDRLSVWEKYASEHVRNLHVEESEEEALFVKELQEMINQAIEQMTPQRRKVYRMSREEGLSNEEIASRLGISKRTVENHLTAALSVLRKILYLSIVLFLTQIR